MVVAKVAFDYTADQGDELDLKVGDIVTNIKMDDGGWWEGEVNGKRGMFPENFVELIQEEKAAPPPVLPAAKPAASGPKKFARVTFQYDPDQPDELALQVGDLIEIISEEDAGWSKGRLNNKVGVFPANFVEMVKDEPAPVPAASQSVKLPEPIEPVNVAPPSPSDNGIKGNRPKSGFGISLGDLNRDKLKKTGKAVEPQHKVELPPPISKPETNDKKPAPSLPPEPAKETTKSVQKAKVLFAYEPEQVDELGLLVGEVVTITNKDVFDGWMQGELNGKSGLFPDNFVELLPLETIRVDDNEPASKPIESRPSLRRAAKENPSPVTAEPPPVESPPAEIPAEKPKFGMPTGFQGGFQAELSKRLVKSQAPHPPAALSKLKVGGKPPPPGPPANKPSKPKPPLPVATKPHPPVPHKPEGSASPPMKRVSSVSKAEKPLPRTNSESRKQPPKPAPPAVTTVAPKVEPLKEELPKKEPEPVVTPAKEGNDEMDFNAVKSSDPLKHMQRAKPPAKHPPSKFKGVTGAGTNDQGSGESSGIDSKEAEELKKDVTELQDKLSDMEKKFQKLLKQVNDELDKSRKVQSEQQIEIDRLRRNLDLLNPQ